MKKPQFLKFSKAIADSTEVKGIISAFENKKGYGGKRTLERWSQAAAGFKQGLPSEVIAKKTGWSVKYVDKVRSWWEEEFLMPEQQSKQTTLDDRLTKHLDELAQTAKILAHRVERLLHYKDTADMQGNVVSGVSLSSKIDGQVVPDWLKESKYDAEHPVDPYLATCLLAHYEYKFGKLPFKEWNQLSTGNVSREIVDNLKFLAYGGLEVCPDCPICFQR